MADARITVCMVLDDSSRRILAGGEFDAKTTENRLHILKEATVSIKKTCEGSLHPRTEGRGIRDPPRSRSNKNVSGSKGYPRGRGVQRSMFKIPSTDDITSVLYIHF
jgi:hypothetical protein